MPSQPTIPASANKAPLTAKMTWTGMNCAKYPASPIDRRLMPYITVSRTDCTRPIRMRGVTCINNGPAPTSIPPCGMPITKIMIRAARIQVCNEDARYRAEQEDWRVLSDPHAAHSRRRMRENEDPDQQRGGINKIAHV